MAKTNLTIACTPYLHTEPILSGSVKATSFTYQAEGIKNIDQCTLRTLNGEFDLGEMSLATFLKIQERTQGLVALPIFSRKLLQHYIFCAEGSSVVNPKDLVGKKVAIPQFWITAGIWHRYLLEHYYDVDSSSMIWCPLQNDRIENMPYPDKYQIDWSYVGQDPSELLRSGEIDAFFYARKLNDTNGIRYLFSDPLEAGMQFYGKSNFVPITHVIACKEDLIQKHPEIIAEVMALFQTAKLQAYTDVGNTVSLYLPFTDLYLQQTEAVFGQEWNTFGWSANESIITTFYNAARAQGFIDERVDLGQCFHRFDY